MELFEALLILFAEAAKDRNKVAHWVWGHGSSLPDAILKAVQKYSDDRFDQLTLRKTGNPISCRLGGTHQRLHEAITAHSRAGGLEQGALALADSRRDRGFSW